MSYETIFFDLGRVLVDFDQDIIARRLMERSKKSFQEVLSYYSQTNIIYDFESGKITPEEVLTSINECFGLALSMEEFKLLWSDIFFENREMEKIVDMLCGRYRLFIISDTNILHYEYISERFPVIHKFEEHILSYQIGVRKPHPLIFKAALKRANCIAKRAIFIDDKPKNVEGARELGITGIIHTSVDETRRELEKLGVLP
jgi:putative hydrolase of the HAD superfamily